jgi:integrase
MYFTSGSDRAFEQLMQTRPGADHFDSGEAGAPEDCGTCRFYRPHWKYQFCVYEECPYQPGKLTALDGAVKFQVKGVDDEMAVFRVEKNRGYTVMSNHHLRNKDLSLKAKGLLSQMLSLPEDWDFTLKGLSLINREQIDAIRAAVRELEQAGYIVRSRERDSQGRLRGADYIIYEQPQPVPDSPTLENPTLDNPTQEKPTQEKPTQLNKDRTSKEKSITDGSNTDSIPILSPPSPLGEEAAAPPERKGTGAKSQSAVEIYREIIKDNIEYEHLCQYAKGIDRDKLGAASIDSVKLSDAKEWALRMQEKGVAYNTICNSKRSLKAIFYMAVQDDCLRKNPFDFQINEVINDDTVPKVPLTPTQENELLDFMQNDPVYAKYYDEVVILLETGLRISELCGLTPADLNFEKRFVNVDHQLLRSTEDGYYIEAPKTESGFRQVPMSAAAYEAFERVLKKRRDGRCIEVDGYKDFLFLNRDGLPKTAVNYDAMFKCLAKKYNKCHKEPLPDVMTPHTMRHTFCTRMANAGMNPKALQYIMGHANIVMTLNYYAHATFHSAQEEMERLQAKAKTTTEAKPELAAESTEETKAA